MSENIFGAFFAMAMRYTGISWKTFRFCRLARLGTAYSAHAVAQAAVDCTGGIRAGNPARWLGSA
jgi:hypothetical protein